MASEAPESFRKLRGKYVIAVYPPNLEIALWGVARACQDKKGIITLNYTDGSAETRQSTDTITNKDAFPHFVSIVSYVQAGRVD